MMKNLYLACVVCLLFGAVTDARAQIVLPIHKNQSSIKSPSKAVPPDALMGQRKPLTEADQVFIREMNEVGQLVRQAQKAFYRGAYSESLALLRQADGDGGKAKRTLNSGDFARVYADLLLVAGRPEEALQWALSVRERSWSSDADQQIALLMFYAGQMDEAVVEDVLERLYRKFGSATRPLFPSPDTRKGLESLLLFARGQAIHDNQQYWTERAYRIEPNAVYGVTLGDVAVYQHRSLEAIYYLQAAIKGLPVGTPRRRVAERLLKVAEKQAKEQAGAG